MKKIKILLASLGFSTTSILAALPAAQGTTLIDVPLFPGGFTFGVQGYDLQLTATDGLGNFANSFSPFAIKNLDFGYEWGWGANIGYIFPQTGNDVELNYFHLGTSTTSTVGNSIDFPESFTIVNSNPGSIEIFDTGSFTMGQARQTFDLNQVDLTAGQFLNIGSRLIVRPEAGFRIASVGYDQAADLVTLDNAIGRNTSLLPQQEFVPFTIPIATSLRAKSNFNGIGPMAGIDASYSLAYGFGIAGHFDASLLIGNTDSELNTAVGWNPLFIETADLGGQTLGLANLASFKFDSHRLVPNWNAKLGVDYTLLFLNTAQSNLTLEVGYQASHYYNAIDVLSATGTGVIPFSFIGVPSSFSISPLNHSSVDIGLQGPYVSLMLHW